MLKPAGIDLHPHVDTVHLAAVETLREQPDDQTISAGQRALEMVVEHTTQSQHTAPITELARVTASAFQAVLEHPPGQRSHIGHYVVAIVADLTRAIDALDTGQNPAPALAHARSLLGSIPSSNEQNLIEIDLNDRGQLARLMQQSQAPSPAPTEPPDLSEIRAALANFAQYAETLLDHPENAQTLDGLVESLLALQDMAARSQIENIGRVVACAFRVVESHRSAGEPLPVDAVEFVIACRRIVPMILESLDQPERVNHAVDALVDQSAFVLLELRRGTRPLGDLWPEPNEAEYQALNGGNPQPAAYEPPVPMDVPAEPAGEDQQSAQPAGDWPVYEFRPDSEKLQEPGPNTRRPEEETPRIRVPVEQIEQLMEQIGELAIRSGGYNQRARRVLSVSQDVNSIGDRLRYLVRGWQDGKYQPEQVQQLLTEVTADLSLAAADLEHARGDHLAAAERQAQIRARLDETISMLRCIPLKNLLDPLEASFDELLQAHGRQARLRVEGASNAVDAVHADQLGEVFRHLVVNALEHGIEPPETRAQAGKAPTGLIRIRARRDGSQTVVQVIDDGAGMDESAILDCAEAAGYPVPRREMTRERVLQYIFLPGFTMKPDRASPDIGMGLDFASEVVSAASGSITVHSDPGRGSVFTLRMPVSGMSMRAPVIAISSERYALPAAEIETLEADALGEIEEKDDGYRAHIGDEVLPAADLGALLGVRSHHHVRDEHGAFLLVTYEDERWVLRVDRVQEPEAITLEPLGRRYHHLSGVVGTAALNAGDQALVLDIAQVLDASSRRSRRLSRQTASLTRVPFALVSDSSISARRQISGHLEDAGWRVVEARDAFEARELLESVSPDMIVVDLDLPAHGGFQIAQAARNRGDVPVLGLTSRDDPELRNRIASFDIDAVLSKPVDMDQLAEKVDRVNRGLNAGD